MKTYTSVCNGKQIFASIAENIDEEKELCTLVSDVKTICSITKKTGLWIVDEFHIASNKVVLRSLKEKVDLDDKDLSEIKSEITKLLKGQ